MRTSVGSGILRSYHPYSIHGVIDPSTARAAYCVGYWRRARRSSSISTDPPKVVPPATGRAVGRSRSFYRDHPINVFVLPQWRAPTPVSQSYAHKSENSLHKAFTYVLGIAISLVSLSALRLFEWFNWPYQSKSSDEASHLDNKSDPLWSSAYHPKDDDLYKSKTAKSVQTDHIRTEHRFTSTAITSLGEEIYIRPVNFDTALSNRCLCDQGLRDDSTNVSPPDMHHLTSPFLWTNATISCIHFSGGLAQVCPLCWLHNPEGWVFGPTLTTLDQSIRDCMDELVRIEALLTRSKSIRQRATRPPPSAPHLGLITPIQDLGTPPLRSLHVVNRISELPVDALKRPRSCGDGAPSATPSDLVAMDVPKHERAQFDPSPSASMTFQKPKPIDPLHISRPLFYNPDSENDTEDFGGVSSRPFNTNSLPPKSPQQLRLSAARVVNKALSLFNGTPKTPDSTLSDIATDQLLQRISSAPSTRRLETQMNPFQPEQSNPDVATGRCSSIGSLRNDDYEYDEVYIGRGESGLLGTRCHSSGRSLMITDELHLRDEEAQLMHLLDTLSTLLASPSSAEKITSPQFHYPGTSLTEEVSATCQSTRPALVNAAPFMDLAEKATDLSKDLTFLEDVLDRLHYKLKATRIGLDNAEDNLDYMWHLRDNLDGSQNGDSWETSSLDSAGSRTNLTFSPLDDTRYSNPPRLPNVDASNIPYPIAPLIAVESTNSLSEHSPLTTESDFQPSRNIDQNYLKRPYALNSSIYDTHHCLSTKASDVDSGLEPSDSISSCLLTSSIFDPEATPMRHSVISDTVMVRPSRSFRPRAKRSRELRRRYTVHNDYRTDFMEADGPDPLAPTPLDSDGFEYPELAFDNDGIIDWVDTTRVE